MAATTAAGAGVDLEKELSCSICTDIFYQPLTLLDCLHTFCGSCLKEWFQWQATSASHSSRVASPYTCPSCRATVRAAKPNANVTTLLDMYLQANPTKGKTEQEKADMRKHYKPGDDVLPPVEVHVESDDSEDERLMDEIRQLSVADLNPAVEANRRAERATRHRRSDRDSRRRDAADARRRQEAVERNVAHQPSLRSLLSASGEDSAEVQQEILTSIMSSGILDGIDVDNLTTEQEDELIERITEAYHRRQSTRARDETTRAETSNSTPQRSRPSSSRPHLIEQWTQEPAASNRRTTPDQRRESPNTRPAPDAASLPPPTSRSATDPTSRSRERDDAQHRRRVVSSARSNTETSALPLTNVEGPSVGSTTHRSTISSHQPQPRTPPNSSQTNVNRPPYPVELPGDTRTSPHSLNALAIPQVSCNRCGKEGIQESLHYHCGKCSDGDFDICLACYRAGRGCNHFFGFGYAAMTRWQRNAPPGGYSPEYELPHILMPRRYLKRSLDRGVNENTLHQGAFCERCYQYADEMYWHCATCLEGAWGFCSSCVQQEMHCTHPLTPVSRHNSTQASGNPVSLPHLAETYYFQQIRIDCAVCNRSIPANHTRLHCSQCDNGNHDICNDSYHSLVATGKISVASGLQGWRHCLQGHPMSILVYRSLGENIQQLMIVSEVVGGYEAKHRPGSSSSPPQSGVMSGLRALALWSWFPDEAVDDELSFPKFAEIREIETVNSDYYVGVYAGMKGLFPANHVKLL